MRKNNYKLHGYISTNRSKHNLKAHLILVCKYRKKLLVGLLNDEIKAIIDKIANTSDFNIIAMESDIDHLHLMVQYLPKVSNIFSSCVIYILFYFVIIFSENNCFFAYLRKNTLNELNLINNLLSNQAHRLYILLLKLKRKNALRYLLV